MLKQFKNIPEVVLTYVRRARFFGLHTVHHTRVDRGLINALVERWRPETHTFHMTVGEATVTLQDVQVLLGLPIDGQAVVSPTTTCNAKEICQSIFGLDVPDGNWRGGRVNGTWFRNAIGEVTDESPIVVIERFVRAYLIIL